MSKKFITASLSPFAVFANADTSVDLGEISITTSSRFAEPVSTVLAPVSVLTREEIKKLGAISIVDALKTLPGIEIGQNGGRGQLASIFLRGTNSNHTLVLIDGVRLPTNLLSNVDFNMLPLNTVERIEVIRGSGATVYGSDAVGGVVNIITRSDEDSRRVSVGIGSQDTYNANFAITENLTETLSLQLMGGYEDTQGYNFRPLLDTGFDAYGFSGKNISARLAYQPLQNLQTNLYARWYQNEVEYVESPFGGTPFKKIGWVDNKSVGTDVNYFTNSVQHLFRVEFTEQERYDYATNEDRSASTLTHKINQLFTNYSARYQILESLSLTGGVDFSLEKYLEGSSVPVASLPDNTRRNVGVFAIANWQLLDNLMLEASSRFDDSNQYGDFTTGQIGLGWDINAQHRAYASVGTAFKAPTILNLYNGASSNPNLKPEESLNYELGFEGFYDYFDWSINAYQNDIDNLIMWTNGQNINIAKVQIRGVELAAGFDIGIFNNRLSLEFRDPIDKMNDEQLARRGKQLIKWNGGLKLDKWLLGAQFLYQSDRPNFSGGDILPSYSIWDFTAQYALSNSLSVQGKIANAFDKKYETAGGYPAAERAYYLNLDFTF